MKYYRKYTPPNSWPFFVIFGWDREPANHLPSIMYTFYRAGIYSADICRGDEFNEWWKICNEKLWDYNDITKEDLFLELL